MPDGTFQRGFSQRRSRPEKMISWRDDRGTASYYDNPWATGGWNGGWNPGVLFQMSNPDQGFANPSRTSGGPSRNSGGSSGFNPNWFNSTIGGGSGGFTWGDLISGVMGTYQGWQDARDAREQEREREHYQERVERALSKKRYKNYYQQALGGTSDEVASSVGPALEQQIASQIAARGLAGSGLAEVLKAIGPIAAGIEAQKRASDIARQRQAQEARYYGAQIPPYINAPSPLLAALTGAAQGMAGGPSTQQAPQQQQQGNLYVQDNPFANWLFNFGMQGMV